MFDIRLGMPSEFIDIKLLTLDWKDCPECSCFFENGKPVALLETNDIENDTILFIYQFEVVNKGNGIGYRIVHELKQIFQLIQLYPQTEKAKHFWEKCGFIAEDEGNGIILMEFSKS